ncbi:MAG: hypothetical protein PHW28_05920 [Mesotoga sp.]|nr:hypothetical protein [Mesotoga sp.]
MKGIIFANAKLKEVGAKMKRIDMTGLIEKYSKKYRKTGKKEKSRILDEFTELTEYNRAYASLDMYQKPALHEKKIEIEQDLQMM